MTVSATTFDIKVSVKTQYEGYIAAHQKYAFAYTILIENNSQTTVQLLRRHWYIKEANGVNREVEGEGVIGLQPVLAPGDTHEYSSWCPIDAEMGEMSGSFLMERIADNHLMKVRVPLFKLEVPHIMN